MESIYINTLHEDFGIHHLLFPFQGDDDEPLYFKTFFH